MKLKSAEVIEKYGFLYKGYKDHMWFWELVILVRKLALAAIGVFMSESSAFMQGLSATFILSVSLFFQERLKPYQV